MFCLQVHMSEIVPWCSERSQRPGRPARGGGREPDLSCHQGDRGPRQGFQRGPQTSRSPGASPCTRMKFSSGIALKVKRLSTRIRSPSMQMRPSLACGFSDELAIYSANELSNFYSDDVINVRMRPIINYWPYSNERAH